MTPKVPIVSEKDPIARVRNIFLKKGVSKVLVYEDKLKGIVTEGDIAKALAKERKSIDEVRVKEIMTEDIIKTHGDETPSKAAEKIIKNNISSLPVVEEKEVKGILTKNNLTEYYANHHRGEDQVKNLMTKKVKTIRENQSAFHAARLMQKNNVSRVIVTKDKEPIAIITEKDLSFATQGLHPSSITYESKHTNGEIHHHKQIYPMIVSDIMQTELKTINPKVGAAKAGEIMLEEGIGSLVVTEKNDLKGIITKTDLVKDLTNKEI